MIIHIQEILNTLYIRALNFCTDNNRAYLDLNFCEEDLLKYRHRNYFPAQSIESLCSDLQDRVLPRCPHLAGQTESGKSVQSRWVFAIG
jgi:hypothetical protein